MSKFNKEQYLKLYRDLYLIRWTEQQMIEVNKHTPLNEIPHSSLGQEAISAGLCTAMQPQDYVAPSLRTRGAFLLRGVPSWIMFAGAMAKDIPINRGKNTSHHMGNPECRIIYGSGILASTLPTAVGYALTQKMKKTDAVVTAFVGDGASNRGDTHEAMNMAAIWDLPIVFVVENNEIALTTFRSYSMRIKNVSERAKAYGMPGVTVDGNDVLAVYEAGKTAFERARSGKGPTLIECKTYRWQTHCEKFPLEVRDPEVIRMWKEERDPVKRYKAFLFDNGHAAEAELDALEADVKAEVEDAVKRADAVPPPDPSLLMNDVYDS